MKVGEEEHEKAAGGGTARKQQQSQQRQIRMMGGRGGACIRPGQQRQRTKSGGGASNKPILFSRMGKTAPGNKDERGPPSASIERRDGGGTIDSLAPSAVGPPERPPPPALVRKMTSTSAIYSSEDTSIDEAELTSVEQRPVPECHLVPPLLPHTDELHLIPVVSERRNSIIDIIQAQNEISREAGIYW